MLKHLVILTLFCPLATAWTMAGQSAPANAPESRVTARNIGKAGSQQANPKQGNPNSPQAAATNVKPPAPTKQQETNAEQETLDIQRKLEWFTGCLMVASLMQAGTMLRQTGLMRGTLKQNRTQAVLMKGQLDQMQRQMDWMLAKERPTLSMRLEPFDPFNNRTESGTYVRGTISIRGNADATILRTAIYVSPDRLAIDRPFEYFNRRIQPPDLRLTLDEIDEILPVVPAGTPSIPFIAMVYGESKRIASDEDIASIKRGKVKLYCKAVIEFSDPLGLRPPLCFKQFFEFVCTPVSSDDVLRYGHWSQWGEYSDYSQHSE